MGLATTPRQLNDGTTIPPIGFGTAGLRGEDAIDGRHRTRSRTATG